jgi:3-carboxy-cis,cis-muconate cycloisomerase
MSARLIDALATTGPLAELFSDRCVLQAMLDFEVALTRAEARVGVIPKTAADAIASAARPDAFDTAKLVHDTFRAGTPGIPLASALTEVVRSKDASAAGFVHWGATSQDVADTALVLLLKRAQPILADDLTRCERSLGRLSEQYRETVMLGRTLLQAGPPVTFGLKAAGWLGAIRRGAERLDAAFDDALVLQFGGATGTLASLGENGAAVAQALADELGLPLPEAPWHTQRDRLASLLCSCGVLTGSLGKMARDITLLMQNDVAEASEPGGDGRGGSSSMPHKQNPIACSLALAAAQRVPGLVASFLSTMVQEHERGVGGWQAEWPIVSQIVQATGVATASMAEVAEGISVNPERMRANIEATRGTIFAERAATLLAAKLGRASAQELVKEAVRKSSKEQRRLTEVLAEMPEVASHLDAETLRELEVPEKYLGSADGFRKALLAGRKRSGKKER